MASNRDIRFPADSLLALRRALVREVGTQAATQALREAGHAAGDILFERLIRDDDAPAATPRATFWGRLAGLFRELGWGTVEHEEPHPGVGALLARDWFEVGAGSAHPTCPFTTGVLANILGRIADGEVAVMVVGCDGSEPGCCRFLFGSRPVLDDLYGGLREGQDLETALGTLG
jgi:predicted hydrocarbon binding protein